MFWIKGRLYFKLILFSQVLLLFASCQQKSTPEPNAAFYHWKTKLSPSLQEEQTLSNLKIKTLYVKFFDLDLNSKNEAIPLASLQCPSPIVDSIQIIPTIFITNRTLKQLSPEDFPILAKRVLAKINNIWPAVSKNDIKEIQFDCDWTPNTQKRYFSFLKYFEKAVFENEQKSCRLSATIRLHQVKYPEKTGVPPVDRGMLMFYNMDDLESVKTKNSILDLAVAKQYLNQNSEYDLPLDIALPIFRWGVLFRNGEMIKLINNLDATDLADTSRFESSTENQYEVLESTYLKGYYLYGEDVIRLEWVSETELLDASRFLKGIFNNNKNTISLYQLDTHTLNHYQDETLQQVFQIFSE